MNLLLTISLTIASLLPQGGDDFWRDSIPEEMRQSYIRYGEQYQDRPWTVLPLSAFAEFKANGNRVGYERLCFDRRRQLAALVMAEVIEGKGRFMSAIIDGLGSLCEETWWGIPAHYATPIPLSEDQTVDLFNAETASLVAWTRYMLQARLDQFSPTLCQRIDREVERRILIPVLSTDYWWKTAGMNWNPWICSNWLACVLICEHDEARKAEAIAQIREATRAFIESYPADGGCDEGPGYWDRAAASMFEVLRLLPDTAGLSGYDTKIRKMAAYAYRTYIGGGYCVNFADAHENKAVQQVNIVYPFGLWLGDKTMREFAAYIGRQSDILHNPAALYDRSGNFPTLGRDLMFLRRINDFIAETPREPRLRDVWLADLQIMTARRGSLFVAMKGGNNGESHNHNDVGSFIVYADDKPLLIDPGVGEYTSKTFSGSRYDIWTMQSAYHNLPQINGTDQKDGKAYCARVVGHKAGQLTLDIAGAYPVEAGVKSWLRTVSAERNAVAVTEAYELNTCRQPVRLMLMTTVRPEVAERGGYVRLGSCRLSYDSRQLTPAVEDLSDRLDPILRHLWGDALYRIVLTARGEAAKGRIRYIIEND